MTSETVNLMLVPSPRVSTSTEFWSTGRVFTAKGLPSTVVADTRILPVRRLCLMTRLVSGLSW